MIENTEHKCFLSEFNYNLILACSPEVYVQYKELFKGKNITVVERDFKDKFTDFYTVAKDIRPEPYKQHYNANPEWSDYAEVYIKWKAKEDGIWLGTYGDIDGFEGDMLVSIKPSKQCDDGNHKIYDRLKRITGIDYKIVYSN